MATGVFDEAQDTSVLDDGDVLGKVITDFDAKDINEINVKKGALFWSSLVSMTKCL